MTALESLLPATPLGDGPVSHALREQGCVTLVDAARVAWMTPYGRNADPADPLCVLLEGRGTCSTKHRLLLLAARECGVEAELCAGIFLMHARNTPRVGPVLAAAGLPAVPEAHCYLLVDGRRIDVTFPASRVPLLRVDVVEERVVEPSFLGAEKEAWHRAFVERWLRENGLKHSVDEAFAAREACIRALSLR